MFLKYIRHNQPSGELCRGTLYSVHFQPNEKGGYNEHLTSISDAYEIPAGNSFPLALIYSAEVRRTNGHMRLALGMGDRQSMLHLINRDARERFFADVLNAIHRHEEVRIELSETNP